MTADKPVREGLTEAHFVIEAPFPAEEISRRLASQPTRSRRFRNPLKGAEVTEWSLALAEGPRAFEVLADAEAVLVARGLAWAREVGEIVEAPDSSAALVIVQRMSENPDSKGLNLSRELVQWLAIAQSSIALDQYLEEV